MHFVNVNVLSFSTFLLVDKNQSGFAVNVYNMSENYGLKIGDNVAIPEPHLLNVQVKYKHLVSVHRVAISWGGFEGWGEEFRVTHLTV